MRKMFQHTDPARPAGLQKFQRSKTTKTWKEDIIMTANILQDLYVAILLTLMIVVVARNFNMSVWFYIFHSILLGLVFIWYGYTMGNRLFYLI